MADKTIPVPEKYLERFKELVRLDTQIYDLRSEHTLKSTKLWSEVEVELDARGKALKYDKDNNTITIFDKTDEQDAKMLSRIREGKATPYNTTPVNLAPTSMGKALPRMTPSRKISLLQRIINSFQ